VVAQSKETFDRMVERAERLNTDQLLDIHISGPGTSLIPLSWLSYRRQAARDREAAAAGDVVTLRAVDAGSPPRD